MRILLGAAVCLALIGLVLFVRKYEIPLPFDANRMFVEPVRAAWVADEEGYGCLKDLDHLTFEETKGVLEGKYDVTERVWFVSRGINDASGVSCGRTIRRDGREVRVAYLCYYKTPWGVWFHGDLSEGSESFFWFGELYDESAGEDYEPCVKEVYYLPGGELRDYEKIEELSDEAFDALREKAELIWSGEV